MDHLAVTPAAGQPPRRRLDDDRLDVLIDRVGDLAGQVGVVATDIGYLKKAAESNGHVATAALHLVQTISADLSASPAGREALRRIQGVEKTVKDQDHRLDVHDDWFAEMRTDRKVTNRWIRRGVTAMTILLAIPSALWTLHLLGGVLMGGSLT